MKEEEKLFQKVKELYNDGKFWEALRLMKNLAENRENYADFQHFLGIIYYSLGMIDESINQFEKALKINPNYIEAHLNLSIALNDKGDYLRAKEHYEKAAQLEKEGHRIPVSLRNNLANTYMKIGDSFFEIGEYERAKEEYERAIEIAPFFLDLRTKHAKTLLQLGEIDKAIYSLKEVILLNPKYEEAKVTLSICFYKKGEKEKAKKILEEVLRDNPSNTKAKTYLKMLENE
ncbi:MAG: tetratricopeptide repeat protein [Candidatus Hydrothermales bacterium]